MKGVRRGERGRDEVLRAGGGERRPDGEEGG